MRFVPKMSYGAIVSLTLLAACAQAPAGGGGIVSVNPCADAILVRLVPPSRIAAISHYSLDPAATSLPIEVARRYRSTAGTAEEVIALAPDLVLASSFTPPATRAAFDRAGLHTVYLDSPTTIAASQAQIADIAAAVGAPARGAALSARIDRALATLPAVGRRAPALFFIGGDLANGSGTLIDEMLTRTGFTNAAAQYGLTYTATLPAERLVADPPAVLIAPPSTSRRALLRRHLLPHTPEAAFPRQLVNCGGPSIGPALRRLAAIRATLA